MSGYAVIELLSALCKRNFLPRQLSGFVRLQRCFVRLPPRYDPSRDEGDRGHCRKGPTCDPLRACDACLRVRGASLGCLYLSDLRLIALEGLFPLLVLGLLAR